MASTWRWIFPYIAASILGACSDPAPPEPEVASIELSVPGTGTSIRFREPLIVRATPLAALGVPLARTVSWTSVTPALLGAQPLAPNGDSARIRATGVGTGQIQVSAGSITQTFDVTVQDTVYSVTVTPGALSLVAGDTVSYTATVEGPNADRTVSWDWGDGTVLQPLTSLDPMVLRVQVRAAGTATVRATALVDTTKTGTSSVTSQIGRLVFVVQPGDAQREVPFSVAPRVEVQDAAGRPSARAANAITLSAAQGACNAAVTGRATVVASSGAASFPGVALSARCPSLSLSAIAAPSAIATTSQPFAVTARGCDAVVPFVVTDTITARMEDVDCVVMRGGRQFFTHTYVLIVPSTAPFAAFRVNTASAAFAPRIEAHLWQQDPAVFWTDSLTGPGTLSSTYWLPSGTHRFVVTSPAPNDTGTYLRALAAVPSASLSPWAGCLIVTAVGVRIESSLAGNDCDRPFHSRPGASPGRLFLLYVRAGQVIQATYRPTGSAVDNDAYLEAFDATASVANPQFLKADDNSGGGERGTDAQLTVEAAATGRFILIRAGRVAGAGTSWFTLTISG